MSPTLVDFNNQTAVAQSWLPTVGYTVENTALDANGNVLFYIRDKSVILPSGTTAGSLPNVQGSFCGHNLYTGILYEIAIVPVPETCNRFFIIWCSQKGTCGTALCATTITVNSNGTLTIGSGQLIDEAAGASSALAVARSNGSDSRSLYWVGGLKGVVSYSISASGISGGTTLFAYNSEGSFEGIEAEVDKNNGYVIWVDRQGQVYSATTSTGLDNLLHYVVPEHREAWGIEFDESEKGFYISTTQTSSGTTTGGILHFPDLTDLSTNITVSSSSTYERTFIEKAKDDNFYAVDKNGILGKFTGNGPVSSAFNSLQVYSSSSLFNAGNHYKLPDQIDGEDYDYFFGVSAYNLTGMSINGTPLVDVIPPPPPAFYNCNPITLTTTWTGSAASYTIQIYSVDPATGYQLSGSQYLNFSISGMGNVPSPIDLRTIGGNSDLFGNYLGQTFAIRIRGANQCGDSQDFLLCYFRVLGPPAAAMINLQVNPGNGIPCNASHNFSTPCPASIYSASLNMGNSSGDVTAYYLKIFEVNCTTGSTGIMIFDNSASPPSVMGVNQLTAVGLNDLIINGSTGYFVNKCCQCYRVEVTICNPCGCSTDYTYIKFTLPSCSCFSGGGGGDRSKTDSDPTVNPGSIRVAPNPAANAIRFISMEEGVLPQGVKLMIFNSLGSAVLNVDHPDLAAQFSIRQLPAGLYAYRLETTAGIVSGQFLKQ